MSSRSFNKNWLSLESLPVLFYFGSILIMSTVFCAFRFFNRGKKSFTDVEKKKQNSASSDNGHVGRFRNACRTVCTKLNFNKVNKYFLNAKNSENNSLEIEKETKLSKCKLFYLDYLIFIFIIF